MFSSGESESENILEENFIDFGIKDITSLHLKSNISTLNLHYNSITTIKGLDKLINLRHLDISSNLITKISGLESLIFLRTLNLSSNRIKKLEGLVKLRQLVKLNLSFNEISDISGLNDFININDHPLTVVELQGNQIKLISHVIKSCQRLSNLRQLVLKDSSSSNPVCSIPDYRQKLLSNLINLRVLDGKDRNGIPIEINVLADIPGLEQFMEYLSSSTDQFSDIIKPDFLKRNPTNESNLGVKVPNINCIKVSEKSGKDNDDFQSELKLRVLDLEKKLSDFVSNNQESSKLLKVDDKSEPKKDIDQMESKRTVNTKGRDNKDITTAKLMKDLDQERQKRIDAENKVQLILNKYKDIQLMLVNDKRSKDDALKSTEKLTNAYTKEKSLRQELENKMVELQNLLTEREKEMSDLKNKIDTLNNDFRRKLELKENQLLNKSEELMQANKDLEESKISKKIVETNLVSTNKHCANLEDQVENLQMTISRREKEYQMNLLNRYPLDSQELKDYVEKQVQAARSESLHEINAWKSKINDANNRYKELENEFRLALHMEADRYKMLEQSYLQLGTEANNAKTKLEIITKKDEESKSLINELTTVAKDQKEKLIEISKSKQETNRNNKERILTLEAHLEEARRQMLQFELTKQENKKIQAKLSAQESILEGLRTERKLWSEELAQQGYLLTQDRAKLECKIESQASEINCLKMEIDKEAESMKIKSKIIEEQTATILKLKEGLLQKDLEAKAFTEKLLEDQKEMENNMKSVLKENSESKESIQKLTKRKEDLKDMIVELQEKLDESESTQQRINQKWMEKSELIAKLENQVVQMKNYWENKTSELMEERDEAREKLNTLQCQLDAIEQNHKSQLELAYKNSDFIRKEAEDRVMIIENEMRRLLLETEAEKKKLTSRLKILNRAIQELESDHKDINRF